MRGPATTRWLASCGWPPTGRLGLLPEGSGYAQTLRGFGFGGDCAVLVAAGGAGNGILGTITLQLLDPASELARDETEADVRAFAVAPQAQGQGVGQKLLLAVIERAQERGVRRVRLCTQPAMRAARHLYETTGFSRTPDFDFEPIPGLTLQAYELALPLAQEPGGQRVLLSFARRTVVSSVYTPLELGRHSAVLTTAKTVGIPAGPVRS